MTQHFGPNMIHSCQDKTLIPSNALKIAPWRFSWILVMRIQQCIAQIPLDVHIVADGFFVGSFECFVGVVSLPYQVKL